MKMVYQQNYKQYSNYIFSIHFIFFINCIYVGVCVHVCKYLKGQKRALSALERVLQEVVSN